MHDIHGSHQESITNKTVDDDDDDNTVSSILSGLETRSLGLNTLGAT